MKTDNQKPADPGSLKTSISGTDPLEVKALKELEEALTVQPKWIKVHAAEYLIALGYSELVKKEFLHENDLHQTEPRYRIGVWRVLAQEEVVPQKKTRWTNMIFEAFADRNGADQMHAIESLAKLKLSPLEKCPKSTQDAIVSANKTLQIFAIWATAYSSDRAFEINRQELLNFAVSDADENTRKISAFGLRKLGELTPDQCAFLTGKALSEPAASGVRNSLLNTAFVVLRPDAAETATFRRIREEMLKDYKFFSFEKRIDLALCLAEKGTVADLPVLQFFLDNENIPGIYEPGSEEAAEVRTAAAFAVLKITKIAGGIYNGDFE